MRFDTIASTADMINSAAFDIGDRFHVDVGLRSAFSTASITTRSGDVSPSDMELRRDSLSVFDNLLADMVKSQLPPEFSTTSRSSQPCETKQ